MQSGRTLLVILVTAALTAGLVWLAAGRNAAPPLPDFGGDLPADSGPDGAATELARYQMHMNPVDKGMRMHFLLDTATGQAWSPMITKPNLGQLDIGSVVGWGKVTIHDLPKIDTPEPGRFVVQASFSYGPDQFLLDTATGKVWKPVINGDNLEFVALEVEGLHKETKK